MDFLTTDPDALDTQSTHLNQIMHSSPFHATPSSSPQKILHISCGTGLLTHHLAKKYPTAQVIGISPKSVDASRHGRLSNLMYVKATLEELVEREDMLFWPGTFDYIFQRGGSSSVEDWDEHVRMVVGLLSEGGWVEMQEQGWGVFAREGGECLREAWEWMGEVDRGAGGKGVDVRGGEKLGAWFRGAGFVGVEEVVYEVPLGGVDESGQGAAGVPQTIKVYQGLVEKFCSKNRTDEEVSKLKESVSETVGNCGEGDFTKMHVVIGQKPSS